MIRAIFAFIVVAAVSTSASAGMKKWNDWSSYSWNNNHNVNTNVVKNAFSNWWDQLSDKIEDKKDQHERCEWTYSWLCDQKNTQSCDDNDTRYSKLEGLINNFKDWFCKDEPRNDCDWDYDWCNPKPDCDPRPDCDPKPDCKPECPTGVPTPGAAGLGLAMLGAVVARRRRQA